MKRWLRALFSALKLIIPRASAIQVVAGGFIEHFEKKSFYAFVGERDWRWISIVIVLIIAIIAAFIYSLRTRYPDNHLKELCNIYNNWIYCFPADSSLERDSVVEIRKRIGKHYDMPFALASVDRVNDYEKSSMLFLHLAIYDTEQNKYVLKEPKCEITNERVMKNYYYRPYIYIKEIKDMLKEDKN